MIWTIGSRCRVQSATVIPAGRRSKPCFHNGSESEALLMQISWDHLHDTSSITKILWSSCSDALSLDDSIEVDNNRVRRPDTWQHRPGPSSLHQIKVARTSISSQTGRETLSGDTLTWPYNEAYTASSSLPGQPRQEVIGYYCLSSSKFDKANPKQGSMAMCVNSISSVSGTIRSIRNRL